MNLSVGFIGIGNMGFPMARNLLQAGYQLTVYDKVSDKAKQLIGLGAKVATNLNEVISSNSIIITMLPNDEALLEVVSGEDGIAKMLNENHIHISMSTISSSATLIVSKAHQTYGTALVAAPVLGRPDVASAKKLAILLAGAKEHKHTVRPILCQLGQAIYDIGEDIRSASIVKLAINFLILSAIEAMGEAFAFIQKNNIDSNLVANLLAETLFACPIYQYHAHKIVAQNFLPAGFRLTLGMKDIHCLLEVARQSNVPMPLASLLYDRLLSALAKKRSDLDWAAITLGSFEDAGVQPKI